jgi:hypothetical protein
MHCQSALGSFGGSFLSQFLQGYSSFIFPPFGVEGIYCIGHHLRQELPSSREQCGIDTLSQVSPVSAFNFIQLSGPFSGHITWYVPLHPGIKNAPAIKQIPSNLFILPPGIL